MHELNKQFLRPSSPSGSQKSSRYNIQTRSIDLETIRLPENFKMNQNVMQLEYDKLIIAI